MYSQIKNNQNAHQKMNGYVVVNNMILYNSENERQLHICKKGYIQSMIP